uniref:Uncharacterized protein n=1 Tax=Oryza glumipatula TaxID=40148 RepID=A0A0D9ZTM5_9ORYZ
MEILVGWLLHACVEFGLSPTGCYTAPPEAGSIGSAIVRLATATIVVTVGLGFQRYCEAVEYLVKNLDHSMPMQTTDKTDAVKSMLSGENSEGSDGSESSDTVEWDPWDPPHPPCPTLPPTASLMSQVEMVKQHHFQVLAVVAASRATNIIAPDRTPQVSHQEVLEGVSSILDDHGFAPTGKGISIGDLECRPYDCKASNSVPKCNYEDSGTTKAVGESPNLNVKAKKSAPVVMLYGFG